MEAMTPVVMGVRQWLEIAVIGLNLCPFAKSVYVKNQVRYFESAAQSRAEVLVELKSELLALSTADVDRHDTTLMILPSMFSEFLDFHDFLGPCDKALRRLGLEGVLQIASFHPQYQFAGTDVDDITNWTNRAPFPILHLLREDSIGRALQAFPEPEMIFEKNRARLQSLGAEGWAALGLGSANTEADKAP